MAAILLANLLIHADALTTNELGSFHALKLIAQRGYLPGVPALVRVELRNAVGPERGLWSAEAILGADQPGITLSTNRVLLRNGLGSVLVAFQGDGDFNLTATVGALRASRSLESLAKAPVTTAAGLLNGAHTWNGVVIVTNDVTVAAGASLVVLSNTLVLIEGVRNGTEASDLQIQGGIQVLGTEDHPVAFTCRSTNLSFRWGQIRHSAAQPSLYRYASITRAGRAAPEGHTGTGPVLKAGNSAVRFEHCNLTDHAEGILGEPGKIGQASGSDLVFVDCLFQRARMGPEIAGTALACTNTWIMDMMGPDDADGIYLRRQAAGQAITLSGCVIAQGDDDGIDTLDAIVTIEDSIIRDWNNPSEDSKGLSVFNGAVHLRHSLIVDCAAGIGAKWSSGSATRVTVDHGTFAGNQTHACANQKSNAPGPSIDFRITNSVFWGGEPFHSDFASTNFAVGFCTVATAWPGMGNINADPLFADPDARDYRLRPGSPCIDAGDPATPPDPDGSRTDMGWLAFMPPPPELGVIRNDSPELGIVLRAYPHRNYVVEFATNLTGGWSVLKVIYPTNETNLILEAMTGESRFYRARWP